MCEFVCIKSTIKSHSTHIKGLVIEAKIMYLKTIGASAGQKSVATEKTFAGFVLLLWLFPNYYVWDLSYLGNC